MKSYVHLALCIIGLCIGAFVVTITPHAQAGQSPNTLIPEIIREINLWRLQQGREPLVYNPTLEAMAAMQADYLLTLADIPADIHAGAQGENPRQRSQMSAFQWPTYGHPDFIQVTEIAAIGSVRSAMNFWTNSEIHTNSSLNPFYREVGVAARQLGSDVLFIVVFGAQPDVLPALIDVEADELYLTTERATWTGDWIGVVQSYRFLDAQQRPINDWVEWAYRVDIPEFTGDHFYVEYEDANGRRVSTRVNRQPIWYTGDQPQTVTNNGAPSLFATNTPVGDTAPMPTNTPSSPTATPPPPTSTPAPTSDAVLFYSASHFTLYNASDTPLDLLNVSFSDGTQLFEARRWEEIIADLNIGALPAGHCLQIGGVNTSNTVAPIPECRWIRSFYLINEMRFFWVSQSFTIRNGDQDVGLCSASVSRCEITLNR
ncbi:MAG: CAP domain-containing protein [Anaerolineae bacterium]